MLEQRKLPKPGSGEVNRSELMTRKGLWPDVRFPRVLGIECVGEVENDPSGGV